VTAIATVVSIIFSLIPATGMVGAVLGMVSFIMALILLVAAIIKKRSKALSGILLGIAAVAFIVGITQGTPTTPARTPAAASVSSSTAATNSDAADNAAVDDADTPTVATTPAKGTALSVLDTLDVKGRAPKTGYTRDQFGAAWSDVDHNGCDTRNDILQRDLTGETFKDGTHDCIVLTGTLKDPYTATLIHFVRGQKTSTKVQIDHVVALSNAWQTGAQKLNADQRKQLANDPYNLLAVDGSSNEQKSDGDAATWLPASKAYRCAYVARQIGVKQKYSLWVTSSEKSAMATVLSTCPSQKVPQGDGAGNITVKSTADDAKNSTGSTTKSPSTSTVTTDKKSTAGSSSAAAGAIAGAAAGAAASKSTPKKTANSTATPQKVTPKKTTAPKKSSPNSSSSSSSSSATAKKSATPKKTTSTPKKATTPKKTVAPKKTVTPKKTTTSSNPYYKNCKAVWNALGHGIYRGDPGYGSHLDRDGDGKACETRPNY
jgi:hypothetical protein